ncbi:MAG: helix-turn-helix transcriptional regulator [Clostridium sp.]|uniref:helix-turn-helix transcriptional regulator n=1 Tax=Clostridium sp. TaxID=1506 RepID=UPI003020711A
MTLKEYLKEKQLTNSEVCKAASIGEATLSQFLNGKRKITLETACRISDALNISLDKFRELTEGGGVEIENL